MGKRQTLDGDDIKTLPPRGPVPNPTPIGGNHQAPRRTPPMPELQQKKPWYKSKTVAGIITMVAGWGLAQIGVNPEIIADGVSADDIIVILGALLAVYGRTKATGPLG